MSKTEKTLPGPELNRELRKHLFVQLCVANYRGGQPVEVYEQMWRDAGAAVGAIETAERRDAAEAAGAKAKAAALGVTNG